MFGEFHVSIRDDWMFTKCRKDVSEHDMLGMIGASRFDGSTGVHSCNAPVLCIIGSDCVEQAIAHASGLPNAILDLGRTD